VSNIFEKNCLNHDFNLIMLIHPMSLQGNQINNDRIVVKTTANKIVAVHECDLPAGRQAQECLIELLSPVTKKINN
jgi:hypothetical protein